MEGVRYISLFSGIEAASVAWRDLGWEPVAFSEIEPFPCAVLAHHYPEVPNIGDITKAKWRKYRGKCDIIIGGSPCQSFSIAGRREGLAGESGLMFEYIRAVREVRPRWFVWENVPGAFSVEHGGAFRQLLSEMDKLGYGLAWRVLDAQFFGVAQRRRRVFLVGSLGDMRCADVLFEPESMSGDPESSKQKRQELAASAAGGVGGGCRSIAFKYSAGANWHAPAVMAFKTYHLSQNGRIHDENGTAFTVDTTNSNAVVCVADDNANAAVDEDLCGSLKVGGGEAVNSVLSNGSDVVGALCARDYKGIGNQDIGEGKLICQLLS